MAEEQPPGADRQWKAEQQFCDRNGHARRMIAKVALHPGVERFADAQSGFHDSFAMNLSEIVVGEQKVNLRREIALQFGRARERVPTVFSAVRVEVISVNQ